MGRCSTSAISCHVTHEYACLQPCLTSSCGWLLQVLSWGWNDRATLGHSHRYSICFGFDYFLCDLWTKLQSGVHIQSHNSMCMRHIKSKQRRKFYGCLDREHERKPRRVAALRGMEITQVSTGGWHCLALDSAGLVYAWGGNEYGQCNVEWTVRSVRYFSPACSAIIHACPRLFALARALP